MTVTRVFDHHPKEDHDPRSIQNFRINQLVVGVPTHSKHWALPRWRLDQGSTPHCGGMGSVNELGASPFRFRHEDPLAYAHRFYYYAKDWQLDPWGREDGTSTLAMLKVGQRLGHWNSYAWARNTDDLKRHLQVGPFLFGVPYRTNMFRPNEDGFVETTGADEGGHLMCAYGWSRRWRGQSGKTYGEVLSIAQSWGEGFGYKGVIRIPMDGAGDLLQHGEAGVPMERKLV